MGEKWLVGSVGCGRCTEEGRCRRTAQGGARSCGGWEDRVDRSAEGPLVFKVVEERLQARDESWCSQDDGARSQAEDAGNQDDRSPWLGWTCRRQIEDRLRLREELREEEVRSRGLKYGLC